MKREGVLLRIECHMQIGNEKIKIYCEQNNSPKQKTNYACMPTRSDSACRAALRSWWFGACAACVRIARGWLAAAGGLLQGSEDRRLRLQQLCLFALPVHDCVAWSVLRCRGGEAGGGGGGGGVCVWRWSGVI